MKIFLKKGFTLLELLVVMVIIGILLGLSVAGFQIYSNNTALQSGITDFTASFRTLRNTSQNTSVIQLDGTTELRWVYYYVFKITETKSGIDLSGQYCTFGNDSILNQTSKDTLLARLRQNDFSSCKDVAGTSKNIKSLTSINNTCGTFIFESVSGKLNTGSISTTCNISFTVKGTSKTVEVKNGSYGEFKEI